MKSFLFALAILAAPMAFAEVTGEGSPVYTHFTQHPEFKKAYESAIADDREAGKPQIIETRAFGEGYDLWKNYLYVQKLAPLSPKLALVLEVKTAGYYLDCATPEMDPENAAKFCKDEHSLIHLITDVEAKELSSGMIEY